MAGRSLLQDSAGTASDSSHPHTFTSRSVLGLNFYAAVSLLLAIPLLISLLFVICLRWRRRQRQAGGESAKQGNLAHVVVVRHHNCGGVIPVAAEIDDSTTTKKKKMCEILRREEMTEEVGILGAKCSDEGSAASEEASMVSSVEPQGSSNSGSGSGLVGWGRWYGLKELESATGGFASENVIGEGGYGIVYRGVLPEDGSVVAVKNLLNNKGQAQKEFEVEVEAMGRVRHKNLVGLIGYCAEGAQRMLVYEYVDNGNLEQWLHGDVGPVSPLTWDIRMKIAVGTAKGLAYLHEGLEPKVVHRDVKSSNILLDKNWNAKVSDFGLAKLLGSDASYVTTRVMGTFGYVSPEYASTGMLNEGSDVYSFGVLLMELITGRSPVDYARPPGERNLVDWFKGMVASRRGEDVVDPLMESRPSPRALKRALLVCLRCIDMDSYKRPKMGQIVHMLEAEEFPFRSDHRAARDSPGLPLPIQGSIVNKMLLPRRDIEVAGRV